MLDSLAPARRRLVLAVVGTLIAAGLVLGVVLVVTGAQSVTRTETDQSRPGPVLLVPGYGGSTTSLRGLSARLAAAGRDVTVVGLPDNGTGDMVAAAGVLDTAARTALSRTGSDSVDVVGYSAGGVVARQWVADGGAGIARRVVTLGSPHHGTTLADLAGSAGMANCPTACRQMTSDSDLLRQLNAGDETPTGPTWVSIWTTQDETVTPPDSAALIGALNLPVQSVCPEAVVAHGELPDSPIVQGMVLLELEAGQPVPLTAADCPRLEES